MADDRASVSSTDLSRPNTPESDISEDDLDIASDDVCSEYEAILARAAKPSVS